MAAPNTVNLSALHLTIFYELSRTAEVNTDRLYELLQAGLWAISGDNIGIRDVRIACLELEHLGFAMVDPATAEWSLTVAGRKMYAMAKAKGRKPDGVDTVKH